MEKLDFKKKLKHLYQPSASEVVAVEVPAMNYLMVDGEGDPNTSLVFQDAVEALFALSYTLKFMVKKGPLALDYGVMPLEGMWWSDDMAVFATWEKSKWKWTLMIMQPDFITQEMVDTASAEVLKKKAPSALSKVRFAVLEEGNAAQTLHIGSFSEEGPTIARVHGFIESLGRKPNGKHHEIYLSDPRRSEPQKWKTVIRQPYVNV